MYKDSDFRWYTPDSARFMAGDYLEKGDTLGRRFGVVMDTACEILGPKAPKEFRELFGHGVQQGWCSLSTPIWVNFGTDRGLPASCFNTHLEDTMESLMGDAHGEISMMSKVGGGTSVCFTPVRGRGAPIKGGRNGTSMGSVHFATHYQSLIRTSSQGSARRGSLAGYWHIRHPDILDVLKIKTEGHPIQDKAFHFGVVIDDTWMDAMLAGDKAKREIWAAVLNARREHGEPYLLFEDAMNRGLPKWYKEQGLTVHSSNLCVTGDQRVVSDRGLKTARELYEEGGELTLFDNDKRVSASPMRLVERNVPVYRITLDNGMTHTVTGYHKVMVRTSPSGYPVKTEDRECDSLREGDLVAIQTKKGLFGPEHRPAEAFLLGLYQGDGTQSSTDVQLCVWEHDFDLLEEIEEKVGRVVGSHAPFRQANTSQSSVAKRVMCSAALKKRGFAKGVVPNWVWEADEQTQWQYIRGLFVADGTVFVSQSAGNPLQLSLASINHQFLKQIQLILSNLGMQTSIRIVREAGPQLLPDGKGGSKEYHSQDCWRLIIGNKNDALEFNRRTSFLDRKGIILEDREYRDNTKKFYAVVSVEPAGHEDVYCCTVDSPEHHWICNGVVTHNCTEVTPTSNSNESFVCFLMSLNARYFAEWSKTAFPQMCVYFMDAVIEEFLRKARGVRFLERAVRYTERHRSMGIGVFGYHDLLQQRMQPFDSPEAFRTNAEVFKAVRDQTVEASRRMAAEYGEPEVTAGSGQRHALLQAVAPTKSSAFIIEQSSEGIEPRQSNVVVEDKAKGKFEWWNPYLMKLLAVRNMDTPQVCKQILTAGGSVQGLDCLTDHEKAVFRTAFEIPQMAIIKQAAQRQQFIDQAQSINVFIDPRADAKSVNALYLEAWRSGVKTLYYQHGENDAKMFARDILACSACEA